MPKLIEALTGTKTRTAATTLAGAVIVAALTYLGLEDTVAEQVCEPCAEAAPVDAPLPAPNPEGAK